MEDKRGKIIFTKYSPYLMADIEIYNFKNEKYDTPRVISLCRCGNSKNKPFCDGTHAGIEFNNERLEEKKRPPKEYAGPGITVYYDKYLCKHIGKCTHGFPEVFNADSKPWINVEKLEKEDIEKLIEVIKKCPSGALSYSLENQKRETSYNNVQKIKIERNGSINIQGGIELIDDNNSSGLLDSKEHYSLCRCGASKHKPFCDGTHYDDNFSGDN